MSGLDVFLTGFPAVSGIQFNSKDKIPSNDLRVIPRYSEELEGIKREILREENCID